MKIPEADTNLKRFLVFTMARLPSNIGRELKDFLEEDYDNLAEAVNNIEFRVYVAEQLGMDHWQYNTTIIIDNKPQNTPYPFVIWGDPGYIREARARRKKDEDEKYDDDSWAIQD